MTPSWSRPDHDGDECDGGEVVEKGKEEDGEALKDFKRELCRVICGAGTGSVDKVVDDGQDGDVADASHAEDASICQFAQILEAGKGEDEDGTDEDGHVGGWSTSCLRSSQRCTQGHWQCSHRQNGNMPAGHQTNKQRGSHSAHLTKGPICQLSESIKVSNISVGGQAGQEVVGDGAEQTGKDDHGEAKGPT